MKNQGPVSSFLDLRTVHQAVVAWWWDGSVLHDSAYHIKVNDSMATKMRDLEKKYGVTNDTGYCCQFEGMMLFGADREQVAAAGQELAQHLARFKHIRTLS